MHAGSTGWPSIMSSTHPSECSCGLMPGARLSAVLCKRLCPCSGASARVRDPSVGLHFKSAEEIAALIQHSRCAPQESVVGPTLPCAANTTGTEAIWG